MSEQMDGTEPSNTVIRNVRAFSEIQVQKASEAKLQHDGISIA
jgi:hypothetical protein